MSVALCLCSRGLATKAMIKIRMSKVSHFFISLPLVCVNLYHYNVILPDVKSFCAHIWRAMNDSKVRVRLEVGA